MKIKLLLGICVIAASVIGILWFTHFIGPQNEVPREASQWHLGKGAQYNPIMQYDVSTNTTKFSVKIEFLPATSPGNQTLFVQINPNTNEDINQTVTVNLVYVFNQVSNNAKPYFTILDSTVFSVRDLAIEDKYLAKGAVWGDMYIHDIQEEIKVTDHAKLPLKFGSLDSYVVSYNEGEKENKLWIVDNLPLPVKAEVYDLSGNLQYSYELTSLSAPLTPGLN